MFLFEKALHFLRMLSHVLQEMDAATFRDFRSHPWHIGVVSVVYSDIISRISFPTEESYSFQMLASCISGLNFRIYTSILKVSFLAGIYVYLAFKNSGMCTENLSCAHIANSSFSR